MHEMNQLKNKQLSQSFPEATVDPSRIADYILPKRMITSYA
jgi:hypothetical protein